MDSALGSCKNARNSEFQALLPVRGKTLNCLKAPIETILKNQIVNDIIVTTGTGVDIGGGSDLFDINKLQFDKVIITTDADIDGYQIRVLIATIFWRLMPELLRQGKIYIAESPLFEIIPVKGTPLYAYNMSEKDSIIADLHSKGIKVKKLNRSKGLGENDPEMLWSTTLDPMNRRLIQLKFDPNHPVLREKADILFGSDVTNKRKKYILDWWEKEGTEDLELAKSLLRDLETVVEREVGVDE